METFVGAPAVDAGFGGRCTARIELTKTSRSAFYAIKPLQDPRWNELIARHPKSSVYHSTAWLQALQRTYGYDILALTTASSGEVLRDATVFSRIESWLTGKRLVSLPFSDHCDPLFCPAAESFVSDATITLQQQLDAEGFRYVEMRPTHTLGSSILLQPCSSYSIHHLDLRPDLNTLFDRCHKNSTQRKIRRAHREGLVYREGSSPILLDQFYNLLLITRRRHGVPTQPKAWFRNLIDCFKDKLKIRIAFKDGLPIAAVLTLQHKNTLLYKYGGSEPKFHKMGGMHLLLWRCICAAKEDGLVTFDLGRTDSGNSGLIRFKDRWGAVRYPLTYIRSPQTSGTHISDERFLRVANWLCSRLPLPVLRIVGEFGYRHVG